MNNTIQHFGRNTTGGRDLIVGDIHGCFTKLRAALAAIGFDEAKDRLFSVGDLVDRGPESHLATTWLTYPWFRAVRGNHEQAAIAWAAGEADPETYRDAFSGGWNMQGDPLGWHERADIFAKLPIGIELETAAGLVGIVHASCPTSTWGGLKVALAAGGLRTQAAVNACMWERDRYRQLFDEDIAGVRAVVVGHNPVERYTSLGNTIYIDTWAWKDGHYTILDAATLRPAEAVSSLDWSAVDA